MTHPFQVGGTYANRKGSYEVVSLDPLAGRMVIRWVDSGETVESEIGLQARIWENMGWEEQEKVRQAAEEEARYQRGYGEGFAGLVESDFKTSTENTTWRSRQGLPGRVSKLLSVGTPYTFVSWSIYGWPVAFLTHREDYQMAAFEMGARKAKYTIELDERYAYYGFYIERNSGPMDDTWDWPRFLAALKSRANLLAIVEQAESEHGARFLGRMFKGDDHFHFANGLYKWVPSRCGMRIHPLHAPLPSVWLCLARFRMTTGAKSISSALFQNPRQSKQG